MRLKIRKSDFSKNQLGYCSPELGYCSPDPKTLSGRFLHHPTSPRVVPPIKLTGSTSSIFWATPCTPATTIHGVETAGSYCCGGTASSGHHGSRFLGGFACLSPSNILTKRIEPNRSVSTRIKISIPRVCE